MYENKSIFIKALLFDKLRKLHNLAISTFIFLKNLIHNVTESREHNIVNRHR
jgi:hypothetical protein